MFKFYFYKLGQFIVNHLSLQNAYRFATFISNLHYLMSFRDRKAVRQNLAVILNSKDNLPRRTREVFNNFGKYLVDFFRMAEKADSAYFRDHIKVQNEHYLKQVREQGKGGIVVTAHIGNWELGSVVFSKLGYPFAVVALPHKERPVNDLFNNQREAHGVGIIRSHYAIRRCLEVLKENQFIGVAADRDFSQTGVVLPFLGKQALLPRGAAILAIKTGAPLVPTFMIRQPDDTFSLNIQEPIIPPSGHAGQIEEALIVLIMKKYINILEEQIRLYPTQWLMFRKFWV